MTSLSPAAPARKSFSAINPRLQIAWDSVSLGALKKCPRYYQLTIVEGWRPKKESHHLRYGQLFHRALEVYDHKSFDGASHDEAMIAALRDLAEGCQDTVPIHFSKEELEGMPWPEGLAPEDPIPEGGWTINQRVWWNPLQHLDAERAAKETKTVPNLFRTVIWYLDQFGQKDSLKTVKLANGKPAVELSFRYELGYTFETGEELLHSGHLDRLALLGEAAYFVDRKTSKNTINGSSAYGYFAQFSPNNQMSGYYFAGKVALGVPIVGGIIDAAQIAKGFSRFERGFLTRTDDQLAEWRDDVIIHVQQAERYAAANYWPMNDTACDHYGGCPLRQICNKDPKVRQIFLATDFTKKPWDPLEVRGDI